MGMSESAIRAKAVGLERAWAEYPADVEEALANAARIRGGFARPATPTAEPTPAYRVAVAAPQR